MQGLFVNIDSFSTQNLEHLSSLLEKSIVLSKENQDLKIC